MLSSLFDDPVNWMVVASGQAVGSLQRVKRRNGKHGLRLDYDFHGGGGFVVMRRVFQLQLPETFELRFSLRGEGPANHFEFKVSDPTNQNAWRYQRPDFKMPKEWTVKKVTERELPFAWGPAGGGAPREVAAVEFAVAAGPGGKGTLWLSDATLEDQTFQTPREVTASSWLAGHEPETVFIENHAGWRAAAGDENPWWKIDFGRPTRFGGMLVEWPVDLPPRGYVMEISKHGKRWHVVHRTTFSSEPCSHISIPGGEARYLRIRFDQAEGAALAAIGLKPDAYSRTPNEFMHMVAADFPRGWFPRYWLREQSYWTPVGMPYGTRRALINEEGMVEVDEAAFSLEPFLRINGQLVTWADAEMKIALQADGSPLPEVTWTVGSVRLHVQPWVDGTGKELVLRVCYRVRNPEQVKVELVVAIRPFQVNPPWQAFRNLGGRSPIRHIARTAEGLTVQGRRVVPGEMPDAMGAAAFEEGGVLAFLAKGRMPVRESVDDPSDLASAAMMWRIDTEMTGVTVSVPYYDKVHPTTCDERHKEIAIWQEILGRVVWEVPPSALPAVACFRTAAAHILINRDGPAIQPGPRRYTRSWLRDSVIMGAALAKANVPHVLKAFMEWYQPFQREDGFIPCVVDRDGVDWLVEHDSHGQFIWGVLEVYRNERDRGFLEKMAVTVTKAADYLIALRRDRLTADYETGEHSACHGLLPESASHEGYLAHPVHSYWDDFWGVRGLEAAADIALELGMHAEAERWTNESRDLMQSVRESLQKVIGEKKLEYIPGSVEWADFDPTATSNAIGLLDFADDLPTEPLHAMFRTYLRDFRKKHHGEMPWTNYTAYEIRIIGAMVRLGQRDEAHELLAFFLSDRRPMEWNQWPEISWKDYRAPGHLGDVPHTWISAEYMLALASMVASEREATDSLVLACGLSWEWISTGSGFGVKGLPVRHGMLDFHIVALGEERLEIKIGESMTLPPGGLWVTPPLLPGMRMQPPADADHQTLELNDAGNSIAIKALPISITIDLDRTSHENPA